MFVKGIRQDRLVFIVTVALVLFGLVMVYSASSVIALRKFGDSAYFLKKQAACAAVGMGAMLAMWKLDYRFLRKLSLPLVGLSFVLLVLVLAVGMEYNGSTRWFRIFGFSLQPSELVKPALIVFMAASLTKRADRLGDFVNGLSPYLVITGAMLILVVLEPDLGTTLVLGAIVMGMLFVAGAKPSHLGVILLGGAGLVLLKALRMPYWKERIMTWIDPSRDPLGAGFQIRQSFMALGGGGLTGVGLGESRQKLMFLPEPHGDFIFAVVGEELGLVGAVAVAALFALIVYVGIRVASGCRDVFGGLLAFGITMMIGLQAFINMGVATGLLPNKGMPLPLISSGGSALISALACIGILLSVARVDYEGSARPEVAAAASAVRGAC